MGSFGESLKRERELRDISLREIADATKISVRYLEALEQNRFDILPGGVFNKGFIKAYANFIGANGDALVDTYLQEMAAREMAAMGAAEALRQGAGGLHRPAEAPKRRASAGDAIASIADSGNGHRSVQPPAPAPAKVPDLSLEKLSAAIDERRAIERAAAGGRSGPRLLVIVGSFVGGAGLVFALLLVARAVTRDPGPQMETRGSTAALIPPPEAEGDPAPSMPEEAPGGSADGEEATEPAIDPTENAAPTEKPAPATPDSRPASERRGEGPVPRAWVPPPIPPPRAAPETTSAVPSGPSGARSVALSPMDLRLEVMLPALVQVSCDGEDRLNRPLLPGEMATMRCFNLIRVSATDAGALRLVVNGRRCAPLGESGSRVQGFAIRSDDVDSICPARGGTSDAGP